MSGDDLGQTPKLLKFSPLFEGSGRCHQGLPSGCVSSLLLSEPSFSKESRIELARGEGEGQNVVTHTFFFERPTVYRVFTVT